MLSFPPSKINIGLYVTARRPDGYHDLETVFYPIPLHDNLEIKPLKGSNAPYALQTAGLKIDGRPEQNLIVRVYEAMRREFSLPPLDIYLYKRVPTGAGLGGGSSDAAAMMTMLNETFSLGLSDEEMERRVSAFGADCAFFVRSRPCYATGIGDRLTPIGLSLRGYVLVLVKPAVSVSTREAYAGIAPRRPAYDLREALLQPVGKWRECVGNDFEESVFPAHPTVAAIKETLYDMGAVYASMTGSGSAVYGLFGHRVDEAERVFADCFVFQADL